MSHGEQASQKEIRTGQTSEKLVGKDFISAGIFSVLALVMMMVATVANFLPQTYFAYSAISVLLMAPVYLIFMAKVPKRWSIPLFFLVPCLFLCVSGVEGILAALAIMLFAFGADLVLGKDRTSFKKLSLAYLIIAAAFEIGTQVRLFLFTSDYLEHAVRIGLDQSYITYLSANATLINWGIFILLTVVLALVGLFIGKLIAKRPLDKAGIK